MNACLSRENWQQPLRLLREMRRLDDSEMLWPMRCRRFHVDVIGERAVPCDLFSYTNALTASGRTGSLAQSGTLGGTGRAARHGETARHVAGGTAAPLEDGGRQSGSRHRRLQRRRSLIRLMPTRAKRIAGQRGPRPAGLGRLRERRALAVVPSAHEGPAPPARGCSAQFCPPSDSFRLLLRCCAAALLRCCAA